MVERNTETRQTLLGGQGDIQLGVILAKLKDRFGVKVKTVPQKIAYRETIKGTSDVQGKHKKQSGGARSIRRRSYQIFSVRKGI